MDKVKLLELIRNQLEADLVILKEAQQASFEAATHEESRPENEYDTRGLEASYLAGAQAKRITEILDTLVVLKNVEVKNYHEEDPISASAVVEVELNRKSFSLFLLPKGGGIKVKFEGKEIQVMTPVSPLGEVLIGLRSGDVAVVDNGGTTKEYEILSVR